jgi:hypothetical protein
MNQNTNKALLNILTWLTNFSVQKNGSTVSLQLVHVTERFDIVTRPPLKGGIITNH